MQQAAHEAGEVRQVHELAEPPPARVRDRLACGPVGGAQQRAEIGEVGAGSQHVQSKRTQEGDEVTRMMLEKSRE